MKAYKPVGTPPRAESANERFGLTVEVGDHASKIFDSIAGVVVVIACVLSVHVSATYRPLR